MKLAWLGAGLMVVVVGVAGLALAETPAEVKYPSAPLFPLDEIVKEIDPRFSGDAVAEDVVGFPDGTVALVLAMFPRGKGAGRIWIAHLDESGHVRQSMDVTAVADAFGKHERGTFLSGRLGIPMIGFEGGGILYASSDYSNMRLIRIAPDGTLLWTKVVSNNLVSTVPPFARFPNGGFVILDDDFALDNRKKSSCRLRRFDGGGDLLWTRIIGKDRGTRPIAVSALPGGEIIVACTVFEKSYHEYAAVVRLTRLDEVGQTQWQRNVGEFAIVGAGLSDGSMGVGYFHYGAESRKVEAWNIARFGPDGEELWRRSNKELGAPLSSLVEPYDVPALYARAMVPLPGGGMVVLVDLHPADRRDLIMAVRLSPDGRVLWVRPVAGDDRPTQTESIIWSAATTPDERLLLTIEEHDFVTFDDRQMLYALPLD